MPTLLAGMHNNAQAPDGAASLESALGQHQDGLIDGGVDVAQVDTADGEKIVNHVFGGQQDQVASQLAGSGQLGGAGSDLVRKLLPVLAPIVMSYLAKKFLGGSQTQPVPAGTGARAIPARAVEWTSAVFGRDPRRNGRWPGRAGQRRGPGRAPGGQGEQGGFGGLGDILGGLFGKK